MENSNLIDNNKVLTFNKIQQIHSTYFLFEKDVENYAKGIFKMQIKKTAKQ